APPIPGLFYDPGLLLPAELADSVLHACTTAFFADPRVNQVMLFGRAGRADGLPPFLRALLDAAAALLQPPALPPAAHALLFPLPGHAPRARQAIVNLYRPGEGIAPHVDLLRRFGDGIVGVSLGAGAAMRFARAEGEHDAPGADGEAPAEVWLPPRSVIALMGEARYGWTHGIAPRARDRVADGQGGWAWCARGVRVSVTFRWLLPGAEVVGG
ncbi:hypothetical protein BC834DRAFT_814182, partial [Gloeopeniophorella convolvens]